MPLLEGTRGGVFLCKDKSVPLVIVIHAVTLKTIMNHFQNRPIENLWEPPFIQNTSVSLIQVENHQPNIVLYGDTSHIDAAY